MRFILPKIAAVHESLVGPKRTWCDVALMSAFRQKRTWGMIWVPNGVLRASDRPASAAAASGAAILNGMPEKQEPLVRNRTRTEATK